MTLILQIHVASALISIAGFTVRGIGMLRESAWRRGRIARVLPHVVDTILLLTGLVMVVRWQIYPWQQPWLAAKLLGLVAYIALGTVALKRGRSKPIRAASGVAALVVFAYILAAAVTHAANPLSVL